VQGPYLVRSATIDGPILKLTGDWTESTVLDIYAPISIEKVLFNDKTIHITRSRYGSLTGKLSSSAHTISSLQAQLPPLTKWKFNDGLPERDDSYDDSKWTGRFSRVQKYWFIADTASQSQTTALLQTRPLPRPTLFYTQMNMVRYKGMQTPFEYNA
jgi:hypothetical protein